MMMKHTRAIGIAAFMSLAVCQTGPALASGPHEEFGGRNGVNAMVYFRLPLGATRAEQDRTTSFGFAVKSEFQVAHPAYQREVGTHSTSTTFDLMDLRFGMNGKLSGFDVGGLNALGAKARLNTVTGGDSSTN
jgi:hypothetical protein